MNTVHLQVESWSVETCSIIITITIVNAMQPGHTLASEEWQVLPSSTLLIFYIHTFATTVLLYPIIFIVNVYYRMEVTITRMVFAVIAAAVSYSFR
jgi:hypothetical protein